MFTDKVIYYTNLLFVDTNVVIGNINDLPDGKNERTFGSRVA